jgi:hypothetical protein
MGFWGRLLIAIIAISVGSHSAASADQCDPLKPTTPQNISQEVIGKFEAKVDGLAKRLVTIGGNIDGTYREITTDVLKEYPNADGLYMWGRTLYLFCVTISGSRLSDAEKLDRIERLILRSQTPPPLTMLPCTPGSTVQATRDTFHLRILAINYGEAVRSIMTRNKVGYAQEIIDAMKSGQVERVSGGASLTVRIKGLATDRTPDYVPFLVGADVCKDMVPAQRMADGVLVVLIPVPSDQYRGQATIVLPRRILATSPRAQVCIEASFPLATASEARQNMYCDSPEKGSLHEAVARGESQRMYIVMRRLSQGDAGTQKNAPSTSREKGKSAAPV